MCAVNIDARTHNCQRLPPDHPSTSTLSEALYLDENLKWQNNIAKWFFFLRRNSSALHMEKAGPLLLYCHNFLIVYHVLPDTFKILGTSQFSS